MTSVEMNLRFTYHLPTREQILAYDVIRTTAKSLACAIDATCPDSREKSLAITKLEEAMMWANAAIARRTEN